MKRFLSDVFKFSLPGIILLVLLLLGYFILAPFKVVKDYKDYSYSHVISNRDYISTTMFLKHHEQYHYDSFIFGISRTLAYQCNSWRKYLSAEASPFVFDASYETIDGIYGKLKFLDATQVPLKNVLIIICRDAMFSPDKIRSGHLFIRHPATSGKGYLNFHLEFIKAYLNPKFLFNFCCFNLLGRYKPFMEGFIEQRLTKYDTITNQINILDQENEIAKHASA